MNDAHSNVNSTSGRLRRGNARLNICLTSCVRTLLRRNVRVVYRSRHPPNGSLNASKGDARARPRLPTASGVQADRIAWRRSNRKPRESGASLGPVRRLVIAHTIVIAMPPIGAPGDASLTAQPPAVVIGVIVWPPIPHPHAIDEYPMATMEAVKVVVAHICLFAQSHREHKIIASD